MGMSAMVMGSEPLLGMMLMLVSLSLTSTFTAWSSLRMSTTIMGDCRIFRTSSNCGAVHNSALPRMLKGGDPVGRLVAGQHRPPPPQVAKDGILVIDGWIMFSVSVQEQRLLLGVRQKLDELLATKIDSPELEVAEAGKELLSAVSQVLASN